MSRPVNVSDTYSMWAFNAKMHNLHKVFGLKTSLICLSMITYISNAGKLFNKTQTRQHLKCPPKCPPFSSWLSSFFGISPVRHIHVIGRPDVLFFHSVSSLKFFVLLRPPFWDNVPPKWFLALYSYCNVLPSTVSVIKLWIMVIRHSSNY